LLEFISPASKLVALSDIVVVDESVPITIVNGATVQ